MIKPKMNDNKVIKFYDSFVNYQRSSKVNDRIFSLYKRTRKHGLNSHSNVLELGSGIGTLTYLLAKTVKNGIIETVEISPKSVEFAKNNLKQKNIRFSVSDIVSYKPQLDSIDFITLFDVIEHIPKEKHDALFQNISSYMGDNTVLLINIPNPDYIEYDQKHQPEVLQIIDQPVHLNFMVRSLEKNGLDISHLQKYSIWVKNDYVFYVVQKKKPFEEITIQSQSSFAEKVFRKLFRLKLKWFYNYG